MKTDIPTDVDQLVLANRVSRFLFHEARLLDEVRLEEWFELWSRMGLYWAPMSGDPKRGLSLFYEDWTRLRDRIAIMRSETAYPQEPRSETARAISNVEVERTAAEDQIVARAIMHIVERRRGEQILHAASVEYLLEQQTTDPSHMLILSKTVHLLGAKDALGNISFLL